MTMIARDAVCLIGREHDMTVKGGKDREERMEYPSLVFDDYLSVALSERFFKYC